MVVTFTTRTDVTAVKFYQDLILAGIGRVIHVFDKSNTRLLQRLMPFYEQKIYGFIPSKNEHKILVFGGKQFTVLTRTLECEFWGVLYLQFKPIVCDDWVHSAVWIDKDVVALLTAHNVVQKWDTRNQKLLSRHQSKDNSILYSGLLLPIEHDVLVMAGTVFSEVIIYKCGDEWPLHTLKGHKGVIFSITCKPGHHTIVTTSDDRSVRIWGPNNPRAPEYHPSHTMLYWEYVDIVCKHEVYGHQARVMRSCITNKVIISVGEDSAICYWDHDGNLLKKAFTHQNGCIWSVDSDDDYLVTGGGDCGVILHPLSVATDYSQNEVVDISVATPKKVQFTARRNIVITDENNMMYYDFINKHKAVYELNHASTYRLLCISSCKQLIAVADMTGKLDIFVENCKGDAVITKLVDTKLNIGKILSMQWAGNRHLVFCTDDGDVTVFASSDAGIEKWASFNLPPCKEASLTAATIDTTMTYFAVGDRCGNLHIFVKGQKYPKKSFSKVHGRYGPRSITFKDKDIITTGRDHSIKYFSATKGSYKLMSSKDLPFAWVEKFLDKDLNIVCGFQERVFMVYNVKNNSKVLEIPCGGGHRSFDAIKYIDKINVNFEEIIKLVYVKNSDINVATFELKKIVPKNIINGSHAKEINCMEAHKVGDVTMFISGGEDTTLRISTINDELLKSAFQDEVCFKHLSSVRTLKTYFIDENKILIISAGGRAQICIKKVTIKSKFEFVSEDIVDYLIKGTDKERKGNQPWKNCNVDYDPEMRIMDIALLQDDGFFLIFAGCSDAYLRVFSYKDNSKTLELMNALKYHTTCILKTKIVKIMNRDVLVTCTTRGEVAFWDIANTSILKPLPFFCTKTNKSGINSFASTTIEDHRVLIATGGDDNAIHLVLLELTNQNNSISMRVLHNWSSSNYHSSQITGLCMVDNILISASIDQRFTIFRWEIVKNSIECLYMYQVYFDVADVQGMELIEEQSDSITVCVFGKGMAVIKVEKDPCSYGY